MAAPGGSGPVGPFPDAIAGDVEAQSEYDKLRRRVLWTFPYGLYLIGSVSGDERNAMTANWVTQLAFDPKLIGVGIEHGALTHRLIGEGGVFSVCTIARDDRAMVRKFTKPVDVDLDAMTLNGFGFHHGVTGAPVLDQAPAYVDCRVTQSVEFGEHTLYVGEIADAAFQAAEDTAVLRMEDTRMNYGG